MSDHEHRIYCGNCGHEVHGEPEDSQLGFARYACETCGDRVLGPIAASWRRVAWAVSLLGLAVADVLLLARYQGPGVLFLIVCALGLLVVAIDNRIVRRHRTLARNNWLVQLARRTERFTQTPHTTGG